MKILKVVIVAIVVILAVAVLTLRVTGLEPEYLDLNQLRAHHMIARPGLWLKGEVVTTPVTDWSFVEQVPHPGRSLNTVLVETRTPYFIPHSVRTLPTVRNGELFIRSHQDRMDVQFPHDKSWTSNVARDPRVRIKIGDKLYEATMVLVADRAETIAFLGRNPETVEKGPDGQEHVGGYDHVYRVFQRNIPEYGGSQPSLSSAGLIPENKPQECRIIDMYFREAGAEVHSAIETTSPITLWTPHVSGTSLCAQTRYPAGTREILECWFEKRPIRDEYVTVDGEKLAQR